MYSFVSNWCNAIHSTPLHSAGNERKRERERERSFVFAVNFMQWKIHDISNELHSFSLLLFHRCQRFFFLLLAKIYITQQCECKHHSSFTMISFGLFILLQSYVSIFLLLLLSQQKWLKYLYGSSLFEVHTVQRTNLSICIWWTSHKLK